MTAVQQEIIRRTMTLTESEAEFILDVYTRLLSNRESEKKEHKRSKQEALAHLMQHVGGFPADFDPWKEVEEARNAKYGFVD